MKKGQPDERERKRESVDEGKSSAFLIRTLGDLGTSISSNINIILCHHSHHTAMTCSVENVYNWSYALPPSKASQGSNARSMPQPQQPHAKVSLSCKPAAVPTVPLAAGNCQIRGIVCACAVTENNPGNDCVYCILPRTVERAPSFDHFQYSNFPNFVFSRIKIEICDKLAICHVFRTQETQ
jgi:hypothetical protein